MIIVFVSTYAKTKYRDASIRTAKAAITMNAATTETSDTFADDWCGKSKENDGNGGEDTHEGYFQVFEFWGLGA